MTQKVRDRYPVITPMKQQEFGFMDSPRDVLHMERVLLRVLRAWAEVPYLRLGQFLSVTFNNDFHDLFGCEDEQMMKLMDKVIQERGE